MKMFATTIAAAFLAVTAHAQTVTLTPANPQPSAGSLKKGLAVSYAYKAVRSLDSAAGALGKARKGPPLKGLSYEDTREGELTLTSKSAMKVIADISGYIRFDKAGTYEVDFLTNDGLVAKIGGQEVAYYDGIHACQPSGAVNVVVPKAGWYPIEATYFQRKGTACLTMEWNAGGSMAQVPDSAFAHTN